MMRARLFNVLILALCLVACVCTHADGSKSEATKSIKDTQTAAQNTLKNAKGKKSDAENYLNRLNSYKQNAELTALAAEKAAKGNPEAVEIAKKVKNASDEALKLFPAVSPSANDIVNKMKELVTNAEGLNARAIEIEIDSAKTDDYAEKKKSAEDVKAELDTLDNEITTASRLKPSYDTLNKMSTFVDTAQLAKYHVDVIVAVAKIETVLKSADNDITLTVQKSGEINATVQEIKNLAENSPEDLFQYISALLLNAEGDISSALKAVKGARKAKEDILEQKRRADDALLKVKDETDVEKAREKAGSAKSFAENAEKKLQDTKNALQSANISANNALYRKNSAETALNKNAQKPDVTQDNKKKSPHDSSNAHQPVKNKKESPPLIERKQPTIPNPDKAGSEQLVKDTTKSPVVIEPEHPTITNPDESINEQPVNGTTESSTVIGSEQPTTINPNQPVSGGKQPKQPFSSDNTMTVSVPLLLALIVCAALQ